MDYDVYIESPNEIVRITADDGKKSECSDDNCKIEKKVIFFPHGKKVTCVWSEICNFIYSLGFEEVVTQFRITLNCGMQLKE